MVNDLLSQMSRTVTRQLMFTSDSGEADLRVTEPLRERLHRPVSLLRADDPVRATDAVYTATLGKMRHQLPLNQPASTEEVDFFISFCLKGLGA